MSEPTKEQIKVCIWKDPVTAMQQAVSLHSLRMIGLGLFGGWLTRARNASESR